VLYGVVEGVNRLVKSHMINLDVQLILCLFIHLCIHSFYWEVFKELMDDPTATNWEVVFLGVGGVLFVAKHAS
jgi:hypothetical protein